MGRLRESRLEPDRSNLNLACAEPALFRHPEEFVLGISPLDQHAPGEGLLVSVLFSTKKELTPITQATFGGIDEDFFDIITMIDFIEHVRAPMSILVKASRLLRPGG